MRAKFSLILAFALGTCAQVAHGYEVLHADVDPPFGRADAIVDLSTRDGARLVRAAWKYRSATLVDTPVRAPGAQVASVSGFDLEPAANADDSAWETIEPETLIARRAASHL